MGVKSREKKERRPTERKIGLHNLSSAPGLDRRTASVSAAVRVRAPVRRRARVTRVSRRARATTARAAASRTSKAVRCRSRVVCRSVASPTRSARRAQIIRLDDLAKLSGEVTRESLVEAGLINANKGAVKVLANGEIASAVTVQGLKVSAGARQKIDAAGGRVEE